MMIDDAPIQYWSSETERNAYNAAFHELGLRWHWDRETYCQLLRQSQDGPERVCHYLSTHQPHLLRAYDAKSLAEVIEQKKEIHQQRELSEGLGSRRYFNWAESHGAEIGA
ncbi:hypothetical protein ACSFA7_29115 [Variovorax sp. LT1R20]|uniref:hypothetical protein n=1 Tax=Variovorax sp. LT1R20 TaxID=3443729 RepID=UPI003F45252C